MKLFMSVLGVLTVLQMSYISVSSLDCYVCEDCGRDLPSEMATVKCPDEMSLYCVVKIKLKN